MTKAELISIIKEKVNLEYNLKKNRISLKVITAIMNSFFTVMKDNIVKGEHIEIRGFGTFETRIREPKTVMIPGTKEIIKVKRHVIPIFRPGRELKILAREYFEKNNPKMINKEDR